MQTNIINCGEKGQNKKRKADDIGLSDGARAGAGSGVTRAGGATNYRQAAIAAHFAMPIWHGHAADVGAAVGGAGYFPGVGGAGYFPFAGGAGYFPGAGGAGYFPGAGGAGYFPFAGGAFQAFVRPPTMQYWPFSCLAANAGYFPGAGGAGYFIGAGGPRLPIHASEFLHGAGAGDAGTGGAGAVIAGTGGAGTGGAGTGGAGVVIAGTGGAGDKNGRNLLGKRKGFLARLLKENLGLEQFNSDGRRSQFLCKLGTCNGCVINGGALPARRHLMKYHSDIYAEFARRNPDFDKHCDAAKATVNAARRAAKEAAQEAAK